MGTAIKTDVVIIGAGPTGLSLACQFVRFGIDFVILEKNEGITPYSKAIGVQARTLEIYEQIGLAQKAVEQGAIGEKARLLIGGEVRGELDFSNIGEGLSPFPFVLMLEQSKNEKLLYEYLQNHWKDVLWKTELESFSQDAGGIAAQVRTTGDASFCMKKSKRGSGMKRNSTSIFTMSNGFQPTKSTRATSISSPPAEVFSPGTRRTFTRPPERKE